MSTSSAPTTTRTGGSARTTSGGTTTGGTTAAAGPPTLNGAPVLNHDLYWTLLSDPQMCDAARANTYLTGPAQNKNVAYFPADYPRNPSGTTNVISGAFWGGIARIVTLPVGSYIYRFNNTDALANYGGKTTGWWTPYYPLDEDAGFHQRLQLSAALGVKFQEWGRLTSAVSEDWGSLEHLLVARTTTPMSVFFGGFAAQDRLSSPTGRSQRVEFDASTGLRLLVPEQLAALKEACTSTLPMDQRTYKLQDSEKALYLDRYKALFESGAISSPTPTELGLTGAAAPNPANYTGPRRPAAPAPAAAPRGSITRGGPAPATTGEQRSAASQRLPGGGRQFYIPNLLVAHVNVVYARNIGQQPAVPDILRWWDEPDAAGRRPPPRLG